MAITAAELLVKVGWDSTDVDKGTTDVNEKVGRSHEALKTGALAIGAGAVAAGGFVLSSMSTIQDAMMPIGTLVGTQSQQFKDLESGIKDMVASSPDSAEDLGGSAYTILSSGITDTKTALKALQDATDLAGAGLGDTAQATDLITSAMNSFKGEGLDSEKAAKTFFGTIASGKTTTAGLAQGFGAIAPLAATAGVKFNDLMAATAALTATGMPASQAYSGIKGALTGIIKPTSEAAEEAKKLGLEFNQQHLAAVGLPAFLDEVKTATGGNVATMAKLFGSVEGLNSVLSLTGGQADMFTANLTGIAVAGENMAERAAEADETFSARFQIMKNKVSIAAADLGNNILGGLAAFWEKHGKTIMKVFDTLEGGFKAFIAAFKAGDGDVTSSGFAGAMERIANSLRLVVDWAVVNWPTFQQVISSGLDLIKQAFDAVVPLIVQAVEIIRSILGQVVEFVQANWPMISAVIQEVAATIMPIIQLLVEFTKAQLTALQMFWEKFGDDILSVVQFAFDHLIPIIVGALNVIQGIVKTFTALLKGDWSGAWDGIKQIFDGAWQIIKGAISLAWDGLGNILGQALDIAKGAVDRGWDAIKASIQWAVDGVKGMFGGMFDGIWGAFRWAINQVINAWNGLHFDLPSFEAFGQKVGGGRIGVPRLNQLAMGGDVEKSGFFRVGERGPENVFLPAGASVQSNSQSSGGMVPGIIQVFMPPGSDGEDVVRALKKWQRTNGPVPVAVSG
jgi:TP901 family phage tail tape measure protein